jgi:hypothetical protein
MPFAAQFHNYVLIVRSSALPAGKAYLRQIFTIQVTFQDQSRELCGSHDYLPAQGCSALRRKIDGTRRGLGLRLGLRSKTPATTCLICHASGPPPLRLRGDRCTAQCRLVSNSWNSLMNGAATAALSLQSRNTGPSGLAIIAAAFCRSSSVRMVAARKPKASATGA